MANAELLEKMAEVKVVSRWGPLEEEKQPVFFSHVFFFFFKTVVEFFKTVFFFFLCGHCYCYREGGCARFASFFGVDFGFLYM